MPDKRSCMLDQVGKPIAGVALNLDPLPGPIEHRTDEELETSLHDVRRALNEVRRVLNLAALSVDAVFDDVTATRAYSSNPGGINGKEQLEPRLKQLLLRLGRPGSNKSRQFSEHIL